MSDFTPGEHARAIGYLADIVKDCRLPLPTWLDVPLGGTDEAARRVLERAHEAVGAVGEFTADENGSCTLTLSCGPVTYRVRHIAQAVVAKKLQGLMAS